MYIFVCTVHVKFTQLSTCTCTTVHIHVHVRVQCTCHSICNRRSWFDSCLVIFFFSFFVTQAQLHNAFHFANILYYTCTCTCLYSTYFHLFCPSNIHIILSTDYFLNASMDKNVVLFIHFVNLMEGLYKNPSSTFTFHHNISHITLLLICTLSYPQCTFYMYIRGNTSAIATVKSCDSTMPTYPQLSTYSSCSYLLILLAYNINRDIIII